MNNNREINIRFNFNRNEFSVEDAATRVSHTTLAKNYKDYRSYLSNVYSTVKMLHNLGFNTDSVINSVVTEMEREFEANGGDLKKTTRFICARRYLL